MVARMKTSGFEKHLKDWGLNVETRSNWKTRGRPYNFYPRAIIAHHDASSIRSGNEGAEDVVTNGRPGLPGPLSQFAINRDGTVVIIAAGYANHAGYGGPKAGVPKNTGNTFAFGIEAANNGIGEKWSKAQLNAYYRLCAALLDWINVDDVNKVFGHKEWTSRKIDPAGIDMNQFRGQVRAALRHGKGDDSSTNIIPSTFSGKMQLAVSHIRAARSKTKSKPGWVRGDWTKASKLNLAVTAALLVPDWKDRKREVPNLSFNEHMRTAVTLIRLARKQTESYRKIRLLNFTVRRMLNVPNWKDPAAK